MMNEQGAAKDAVVITSHIGVKPAVAYLKISGMGCSKCEERVRAALLRLDGVALADVRLSAALAGVLYDPQQVTPSELVAAVAAAGEDGIHEYSSEFLAQVSAELTQLGWI